MRSYAFLGGAFDPVHCGHIKTLEKVNQALSFDELYLLPYKIPPTDKKLVASAHHRLRMLEIFLETYKSSATAGKSAVINLELVDMRDDGPSFSYNSLQLIRQKHGDDCHLSLIIGDDAYFSFSTWFKWQEIFSLSNLIVVQRLSSSADLYINAEDNQLRAKEKELEIYHNHNTDNDIAQVKKFKAKRNGAIFKLATQPHLASSSKIRHRLSSVQPSKDEEDLADFLPDKVYKYILENNLYS